ncbi:MAG TPA: Mut7-C RNAse domain-containing protein [Acidobacteriota bacterium]|nr:Mut7-C RNAse domain-containing protein [Acidobacteriota bacterium]
MGNSATRKKAAFERHELIRSKTARLKLPPDQRLRFVADVMLGRLAKWLRIAGFDVLYSNRFTDDELIETALREDRVLLSRDTRLLIRKPVEKFLFLESQEIRKQIEQVFASLRIRTLDSFLKRCPSCNDLLVETEKESVRNSVPVFVYKTQPAFKSCPGCGKIFWAGTHRTLLMRTLQTAISDKKTMRPC